MTGTLAPDVWEALTEKERDEHMEKMTKPYSGVNGHRIQRYAHWINGRPIWSSAYTTCTDNCPACRDGEILPDW